MGVYDVQGVLRTWVDVKSFGAAGNGVSDDTVAIQSAINSIRTVGGVVHIPAGIYYINSAPICLYSDMTLDMDNSAVLLRGPDINHILYIYNESSAVGYTGATNITIRGGIIDENPNLSSNHTAVNTSHAFNVRIENMLFRNASGTWHYIEVNSTSHIIISGCTFLGGDNSEDIQLDAANGSGNYGQNDGTVCRDVEIVGCYFDSGAHPAIGNHSAAAHTDIRIHDCVFHNSNTRGAIDWAATAQNVDVYDCTFYTNTRALGFADSQIGSTFHDNRLENVTTAVVNCTAYDNVINGVLARGTSI